MNTCIKCGQKFLCKGHKDQFSTFETCIHITAFKTLLYTEEILVSNELNFPFPKCRQKKFYFILQVIIVDSLHSL
jgi:hypothetical protein